jgi:hypothetical protein
MFWAIVSNCCNADILMSRMNKLKCYLHCKVVVVNFFCSQTKLLAVKVTHCLVSDKIYIYYNILNNICEYDSSEIRHFWFIRNLN